MSAIQRIAAGLGACLLVAALGWSAWRGVQTVSHRAGQPFAAPRQASPLAATVAVPSPNSAASAAATATTRLAQPVQTSPSPLSPGDIEICGFGVAKNDADAKALQDRINQDLQVVGAAHAARMVGSTDAKTRAVGLLLAGQIEPLARMAWQGSDPTVYAYALHGCGIPDSSQKQRARGLAAAPSCALLSAERGAAIDPNNGHAWLVVAAEAAQRNELDNVAQALRRATAAPTMVYRLRTLASIAMAEVAADTRAADLTQILTYVIGVQAAMPIAYLAPLIAYCAPRLLADANRRQECDALANWLVVHSGEAMDLAVGRRLGRDLAWPADRLALLDAESKQLTLWDLFLNAPGGLMSCVGVSHQVRVQTLIAEHGERHATRLLQAEKAVQPAK